MDQRIHDLVSERREQLVSRLQDLVRIDTRNRFSGDDGCMGERPGQQYLEPLLTELGATTTLFDCPDNIYERMGVTGPEGRDFSDRPNLVGECPYAFQKTRLWRNIAHYRLRDDDADFVPMLAGDGLCRREVIPRSDEHMV